MDIKHRKKDHKEQQALHSKQQEKENGKEDLRLEELDDLIVWNVDLCYNTSLFICSFLALVARCWMIHNPGEVVFDEVHFGKFASFYLRGEYYFDVHPPLAKLLLAGVGWLVGYDGHFLFETIGQDYAENNVPYIAFRIWCAFCGAAVIPVSFLIMKELGASVIACTLGALLLAFGFIFTDNIDNALVAQSRLILLDSMLWLTGILAIYFWIKFRKLRHEYLSNLFKAFYVFVVVLAFNVWIWTGVGYTS
jgi:dolichyl-phosphate-mannose-protein mannosyltransferase